jgi:hypothetical protein
MRASHAKSLVASGRHTPCDKTEREERSIERAFGQHCEGLLVPASAVDPDAIGTLFGPPHIGAPLDAHGGLMQIDQAAGVATGISEDAVHTGSECSLRARVRPLAAQDTGLPMRETQAAHPAAQG